MAPSKVKGTVVGLVSVVAIQVLKLFSSLCGLSQKPWLCVLLGVTPRVPVTMQCSPSIPQQEEQWLVCPLCVRPLHQQPLCVALVFSSLLSVGAKLFPAPGKQGVVGWAWAVTLAPLWELCDPGWFSQWLAVFRGHGHFCAHLFRSKVLVLGHAL